MSVAVEFAPVVPIPAVAQLAEAPIRWARGAPVTVLHVPSAGSLAPPLGLTRRGVAVLSATVAALGAALVALAALSAPGVGGAPPRTPPVLTVHNGDTLWSIATRLAPTRDPREEIALLQRVNHLSGVALMPGQRLRTG